MSVITDDNISVKKKYNKISKYKGLEIKMEKKMWYLKMTMMSVKVGALGMIKKGIDKHINKIPSSYSLYEKQKKLHFAELLISQKWQQTT